MGTVVYGTRAGPHRQDMGAHRQHSQPYIAEGCDLDSGAEDKARTMGSRLRIDGPSFPTAFLSTPLGLW
jgi:hypothetical protein